MSIHGYFRVDLDIVWDIVETELPRLRHQIAELLPYAAVARSHSRIQNGQWLA